MRVTIHRNSVEGEPQVLEGVSATHIEQGVLTCRLRTAADPDIRDYRVPLSTIHSWFEESTDE